MYSNEYFTWLLIIVNTWFSNIEAVSIHPRKCEISQYFTATL